MLTDGRTDGQTDGWTDGHTTDDRRRRIAIAHRFAKNGYLLFWGHSVHPRSKVTSRKESPYMISYMSVIQMKSLSHILFEKNGYLLFRGHSVQLR